MPQILATADIGSNTVHLLIAETDGQVVRRIDNQSRWLGLGEAVTATGVIDLPRTHELVAALNGFRKLADSRGASMFYIFATEAMRRAENHNEVLTLLRKECGLDVDIISPEAEMRYAIAGTLLDTAVDLPTVFFDVGGGSAQIARMDRGTISDFASLPIGTGALRAQFELGDPPSADAVSQAAARVDELLTPIASFSPSKVAIGSGGVARGLLKALHPDRERKLQAFEIDYMARTLASVDSGVASARFGLSKARCRTLLPGSIVVAQILSAAKLETLIVSEFGIREGAVLAMANGSIGASVH